MKIQFLGAARTVTGSCFLVKTKWAKFLIDCGMFQGEEFENRNYEQFEFDPKSIDFVLLTHSHLDHCGLLPKLYKEGFRGKVYMTPPTRQIVENMLLDSAKVQEIKYRESKKKIKGKNGWELADYDEVGAGVNGILYETPDVLGLLGQAEIVDYEEDCNINKRISVKFLRVGHALGASSICVTVKNEGKEGSRKFLFSGDIGNSKQTLDSRFSKLDNVDFVIMESLYGGLEHEPRDTTIKKLVSTINKTLRQGGNVLIPAFTYQRSQDILYILKALLAKNKIPGDTKVYLDSPLAMKNLEVYKKFYKNLNKDIVSKYSSGGELFACPNIIYSRKANDSKRINKARRAIIIAGHGMCVGGRIRFHLLHNLEDKRASVIFIGFQAPETLGREIIDGKREVFIDDKKVKVKAEIVKLFGFSAHADNEDLLNWIGQLDKKRLKTIFLIHAEERISLDFERILEEKGYNVVVPEWKEEYELK